MPSRVVLDLAQLKELTYTPGMAVMLHRKAQAVVNVARSRAPVRTGRYSRSFSIAPAQTDRKVIRVFNNAPWAIAVEYGGSSTGKSRPLGSALDAAGGS